MAEYHVPALDKMVKDLGKQMTEICNRPVHVAVPRGDHLFVYRGPAQFLAAWCAALDKLAP
jgi:hypothetical protein